MISTILTPVFRSTPCLGEAECYPLAFGVPAALMFVALGEFQLEAFIKLRIKFLIFI